MDLKGFVRAQSKNPRDPLDKDKYSLFALDLVNSRQEAEITPIDLISLETTLIWAGPPLYNQTLAVPGRSPEQLVFPVGMVTSFSYQQTKEYTTWDESGLKWYRHVPNKLSAQVQMGRLTTSHTSLLYALYRWLNWESLRISGKIPGKTENVSGYDLNERVTFRDQPGYYTKRYNTDLPEGSKEATSNNFLGRQFNNLGCDIFCVPFGLLIIELDKLYNKSSALYIESCKIPSITKSGSPDSPVVLESTSILAGRCVPATKTEFAINGRSPWEIGVLDPKLPQNTPLIV